MSRKELTRLTVAGVLFCTFVHVVTDWGWWETLLATVGPVAVGYWIGSRGKAVEEPE